MNISKAVARFWSKVDVKGPSECWEWKGGMLGSRKKYGEFWVCGQGKDRCRLGAHQFSYMLSNVGIPHGMHVLHSCDNPKCVNPAHLYVGTDADNKRDMVSRGRAASGERNGSAIHADEAVARVRSMFAAGMKQAEIVRRTGIPRSTVHNIVRNKSRRAA